jgi:hypothetical protein
MRRLILGVALLAIIVGAATLGFAAGGHATSAPAAAPVHLHWANFERGGAHSAGTTIGRARLDGTGVEHSFVSGTGRRPCGVALDRKHIYWAEQQGGIGRANRDGSGVNASFVPKPGGGGCGVAIAGGHIYWASGDHGTIGRANVDGSGVDGQFITGLAIPSTHSSFSNGGGPCGIAVAGKYIYWINFVEGSRPVAIGRANLDGTGVNKRFIPGRPANGCGIAVAGGYIYWTNAGFVKSRYAIGRANLDGTGVNHRFIRTANIPCGIAAYQGHIYWGEWKGGYAHPGTTIGRANLDGSAVNNQFITGIQEFCLGDFAVG